MKQHQNVSLLFFTIAITWTGYRYFFQYPEWVDEFIAKPLLFILPTLLLVVIIEKQKIFSIGLSNKNFLRNSLIGLLAGTFFVGEALLTKQFKYSTVIFNPNHLTGSPLLLAVIIPFATAFSEEIVFRGYIFSRLWKKYNSELIANTISTTLFVIVHLPVLLFVQHLSNGALLISLVQICVLGAINAILYARTKTLTASVIAHGLWNLSVILFM